MPTKVHKIGNSFGIYIPKAVAERKGFKRGTVLKLQESGAGFLVLPLVKKEKKYTLAQLLKGVTKRNTHPLVDWGPAVGKEIW